MRLMGPHHDLAGDAGRQALTVLAHYGDVVARNRPPHRTQPAITHRIERAGDAFRHGEGLQYAEPEAPLEFLDLLARRTASDRVSQRRGLHRPRTLEQNREDRAQITKIGCA
jgi:hypothetical protein